MVVVYDAGHSHIRLQRVRSTQNPPPALVVSVTTFSILVISGLDQPVTIVPDIPQTILESGYTFHVETWTNECNFAYFHELYSVYPSSNSKNIYACAATSAVKKKFRFPATDPDENDVKDTRSDLEKISDIIRVWSQVLNPAEQSLWNEIAERNLSHDISLSGIRTPKTLIDDEIKKYRHLNANKQKQLLQALSRAPSEIVTPLSHDQPVTSPPDDPLSIMPG